MFQPPFNQPFEPIVSGGPNLSPDHSAPPSKGKAKIILAVAASIGLLVIIGLTAALMSNSSPKSNQPQSPQTSKTSDDRLSAATANSMQVVNDAISQDISSLNDDRDFSTDKLTDKTLGL